MDQIFEFFNELLGTEKWPSRWLFVRWTPFHGWMYIVSDILIWAAYFTIPVILIKFIKQKKGIPLTGIFLLFGAFILMSGLTHLLDAMFYWPAYRLSSLLRMATAIISWFTVFALFKVMPQALKLKTSNQFEVEIEERKKVESELRLSGVKV
jgi:chemotaxis family two-component system sensor kinase Cph1